MKKEVEKELKDILIQEPREPTTKDTGIIFDGRQYSVRIPKKFVDVIKIDPKKDKFKFSLEIPTGLETPTLKGELVKN